MKKFIVAFISAILFNVIAGSTIAFAAGVNPAWVIGLGTAATALIKMPAGAAVMAVQKEIWLNTVIEGLFADNSFLSKAFSADEFVEQGKTVHIPNAGSGSATKKNRTEFPATVSASFFEKKYYFGKRKHSFLSKKKVNLRTLKKHKSNEENSWTFFLFHHHKRHTFCSIRIDKRVFIL